MKLRRCSFVVAVVFCELNMQDSDEDELGINFHIVEKKLLRVQLKDIAGTKKKDRFPSIICRSCH